MVSRSHRLVLLGALGLCACAPKEVNYQVKIVSGACDALRNPLDKASQLLVRVKGDAMETVETTTPIDTSSRTLTIPSISSGKARVIEVRACTELPCTPDKVVSVGRSLPFDVPEIVPEDPMARSPSVTIFLRRVGVFSATNDRDAPGSCTIPTAARAGLSATVISNGRVFVAGGFKVDGTTRQSLTSTEIYDVQTGRFAAGPAMEVRPTGSPPIAFAKAFHTSTLLPNGLLVLWGGENYQGAGNAVSPTTSILLFNADAPGGGAYGAVGRRVENGEPAPLARSRHAAALDKDGRLLIVGGYSRVGTTLTPVDHPEWLDVSATAIKPVLLENVSLPRMDTTLTAVQSGKLLAVAGGFDGTRVTDEVSYLAFDGKTFLVQSQQQQVRLKTPRRNAAAATLGNTAELLVAGGFGDAASATALSNAEVVTTTSNSDPDNSLDTSKRADACAVTLDASRAIVIGGKAVDPANSLVRSDASSVVVSRDRTGRLSAAPGPTLPVARWAHACTRLPDGSVLVVGGANENGGSLTPLQDAWIYMPVPLD